MGIFYNSVYAKYPNLDLIRYSFSSIISLIFAEWLKILIMAQNMHCASMHEIFYLTIEHVTSCSDVILVSRYKLFF